MKMVAVLAGCGGLVFLVIGYQARLSQGSSGEQETSTELAKPPAAPFPQALFPACQGQAVAQAAEYKSGNGAHPLVFFHLDNKNTWTVFEDWQERVAEEWQATEVEKTQLVVLVSKQKKVFHDRTPFQEGPPVTRYKFELDVYVRAAKSGEVLCHKHFINLPRHFRDWEEMKLTALGLPVAYKDVFSWLTTQAQQGFEQDSRPYVTRTKYQ